MSELEDKDAEEYFDLDPAHQPTPEDLHSAQFKAVWNLMKDWDISRKNPGEGRQRIYAGATGSDVKVILLAIHAAGPNWASDDEPIDEDESINSAHPTKTNLHGVWAKAEQMVSAKRSKFALVALVNWLLQLTIAHRQRMEAMLADTEDTETRYRRLENMFAQARRTTAEPLEKRIKELEAQINKTRD